MAMAMGDSGVGGHGGGTIELKEAVQSVAFVHPVFADLLLAFVLVLFLWAIIIILVVVVIIIIIIILSSYMVIIIIIATTTIIIIYNRRRRHHHRCYHRSSN